MGGSGEKKLSLSTRLADHALLCVADQVWLVLRLAALGGSVPVSECGART